MSKYRTQLRRGDAWEQAVTHAGFHDAEEHALRLSEANPDADVVMFTGNWVESRYRKGYLDKLFHPADPDPDRVDVRVVQCDPPAADERVQAIMERYGFGIGGWMF